MSPNQKTTAGFHFLIAVAAVLFVAPATWAAVTARYIRVDNPTGFVMEWRQIQIDSGGVNIVLHHPEMISGTLPPAKDNISPTEQNIILTGIGGAKTVTDGIIDTHQRATEWRALAEGDALHLNPWLEVDLGKPTDIDKIVLYASRYPSRLYLDKGHRVVSALDADRHVVWADRWQYYDTKKYPDGVFTFAPASQNVRDNPVIGVTIPARASDWVAMGWLLNADSTLPPSDSQQRMRHFADRNSPAEVERLAKRFFEELDDRAPGLESARLMYAGGQYEQALTAWKTYWFAKMARLNTHQALHGDYVSYRANGDDLLNGIMVSITPEEARAIRYVPGQIHWVDLPDDAKGRAAAMQDCERKAKVGSVSWPLLYAYRRTPDAKYLQRWSEIMDDWSLNFFVDAAKSPYEVENLFTFSPATAWQTMMEDLSDIARERPELIDLIPATTLARVQLLCLEKYTTAWWRQTRETVFNHITGGLYQYDPLLPYVQEFHPGQRARREWLQGMERWMTLGTERDGSMTEIGDDGHMEMPVNIGVAIKRAEQLKPAWYTPGWRNRVLEMDLNTFKYMFRHLAPGGYEHRFAIGYRPSRWTTTWKAYLVGRATGPIDRDADFFTIPEVRRMLDAWGHISTGVAHQDDPIWKPITLAQEQTHEQVRQLLGNEKPGMPHINSDWMPYTGAYYFRGSWADDAPFLAMMACGSHGGSQGPQWPYGMFYHYDYRYPLIAAQPIQVDGLPPQQLYGRMNCFQPGTKTMALTNADEKPAQHRWLSDPHFDFGEAIFRGGYQNFASFTGDGPEMRMIVGKAVPEMHSVRQVLQLRDSRLFIITDAIESPDNSPHEYSIPYKFSLSTRHKGASRPFSSKQLSIDAQAGRIRSDNPDGPSVTLYQFSDQPVQYRKGRDVLPDFKYYAPRLTSEIGIADQGVSAMAKSGKLSIVSVIDSRDAGAADRVAAIESMNQAGGVVGFHAQMKNGQDIWYQSAPLGSAHLTCGPGDAIGQALLVVREKGAFTGMVLSGKDLVLDGKKIAANFPDFEFSTSSNQTTITPIYTPIDPVTFQPDRNTFVDGESVEMVSKTPNVEIRYTIDGTPPSPASLLYSGPVKITQTTEFAARAYRLDTSGHRLAADNFEINGTRFTVPSYGWFHKEPLRPAMDVAGVKLQPGLNYDVLQAPWWRLYAEAHWLPAEEGGVADREMDLSRISSNDPYGVRYQGYIKVPVDGLYTFQAPHELCYMDNAPSYDLRVYVDGEEWYLTQWWHGHGTWTIPLQAGLHRFQVDFADARSTPWRKSGIWRYFPRPWAIYQGKPTDILISGPGLRQGRIPPEWFFREPRPQTYADERVLVDSANELNCTWDNAADVPLTGVDNICFETPGNPSLVFGNLNFIKPDGSTIPFSQACRTLKSKETPDGIFLNLHGGFDRLRGALTLGAKEAAKVTIETPRPRAGP